MKALLIYGGWDGHTPAEIAEVFSRSLSERGFGIDLRDDLACLTQTRKLKTYDLIVPIWTLGALTAEQSQSLSQVIRSGVGLAGIHGGMCDAFRGDIDYQWMTGGQFLGHPYVGQYTVTITAKKSQITQALRPRFRYDSEQYYMMVDPSVDVLAETVYRHDSKRVKMPVVWTKSWGEGKVFYSALGHHAAEFTRYPKVLDMTIRGMCWAASRKSNKGRKTRK